MLKARDVQKMLAAKGGKNFIGCGFKKKGKEEFVFCLCQTVIK